MIQIFNQKKITKIQSEREQILKGYQTLKKEITTFSIKEEVNFKATEKLTILFDINKSKGKTIQKAEELLKEIEEKKDEIIENGIYPTEEQMKKFKEEQNEITEKCENFLIQTKNNFKRVESYISKIKETKERILEKIENNSFYPDEIAKKTFKLEEYIHDIKRIKTIDPYGIPFMECDSLMDNIEKKLIEFEELYEKVVQYINKMNVYEENNHLKESYEKETQSEPIPSVLKQYLEKKEKLYFSLHKGDFEEVKKILKSLEE